MRTSRYIPPCCACWWDNGQYVVGHDEHHAKCRHTPSGGTAGKPDGVTMCNRIIGHGRTRAEAIDVARVSLGMG
jgi:heat shock protein HslJ